MSDAISHLRLSVHNASYLHAYGVDGSRMAGYPLDSDEARALISVYGEPGPPPGPYEGWSDAQWDSGAFETFTAYDLDGCSQSVSAADSAAYEAQSGEDIAPPPLDAEKNRVCAKIDAWRDGPRGLGGVLAVDLDGDGPAAAVPFKIKDIDLLRDAAEAVEARISAWETEAAHAQQIGADRPSEPDRTISWILADNSATDLSLADVQAARIALIAERERITMQAWLWKGQVRALTDISDIADFVEAILAQIEGGG